MKSLAVTAALLASATVARAQTPSTSPEGASWMRYPAISPDGRTLVFTYKGDLYTVPRAGGAAVPLTSHAANDVSPVWSPDGRRIAFASDRNGNYDVYVVGVGGGEPTRLTFHSAPEMPSAFTTDGARVLFTAARQDAAANRLYPTAALPELYAVPAAGGRPIQLLTTPAENARPSADGRLVIYEDRKGGENAWRKHHTSAVARDLWVMDTGSGEHRQVTTFAGEDRNPVFARDGKSFYYLSEAGGTFNVFQQELAGGAARQLTRFAGVPVRFLSMADDGTLAFGWDGQVYTMAPGGQPARVPITVTADDKSNRQRILSVSQGAQGLVVSPNGKEVAFLYRGDVFVNAVEGGGTKRVTHTPEAETGLEFSPDGKALVYASERGGKWAIYEARRAREAEPYFYASTVIREAPLVSNDRQNTHPSFSPDGKTLAYLEDRNTLKVLDLASKQARALLGEKELFGNDHWFQWSPDGRWIAFDLDVPGIAPGEVGLVRADGSGSVVNLTQSGFHDARPRWILGGKAMMWFSNRDGLKSVAQSGSSQSDAYAMFFDREAWERFRASKDEFALIKEADERAAKLRADSTKKDSAAAANTRTPARPLQLDLADVDARRARLTVASAAMGDALVSKDGETLYYLARFERGLNLWSTNLRTRETKMLLPLNANSGNLAWDKEQKYLFLLADSTVSRVDPAAATPRRDVVAISGEESLDVDAERAAMFDHVWRRTRDTFYTRNFHGVDWNAQRAVYAKYLPHVGTNAAFVELLAELLGELNVSHSGASYAFSTPTDDATASLGVLFDPTYEGVGAKIVEVLRAGPLDRSDAKVRAGMIVRAVDGVEVAPNRDIAELLNRKAGKNVLLTLADGAQTSEVVVKPVSPGEEGRLLYARWVRRNADEVDKASGGTLGYVHIPGMNDGAYRTTFEEVMGKYATRQGVVVDTRNNGGGDLVADLAMFLSGQRFFDYTTDTRSAGYEPNFRWTRPTVALANEANYSDGHCFAYAYKQQKLGPLVGMPVPGTCTFAGWESLPDGIRWGVPGLGVKDATTGQYLENLQTEPDVKVRNDVRAVATGKDQQLEAAIAALRQLTQPKPTAVVP
ncbi:S41 family peptidase [Roseisolibacter sp. H3M3-2]|uniref:S41 family peptidase n=1 Tax=Roseisolibacter sp. H3M3-2 TaxID=3031323 RepID=UPI0023DB2ABE|nr:S41 family peptidase [Roseisolibacter sp. H3M3-2]MDF1502962.1 S41 family peptidase [Roseisolibacter sp. H3M3-2]